MKGTLTESGAIVQNLLRLISSFNMPYSHHSHSGQFCNHASDQLEDVVQEAIKQGMQVFAMTEHMPRNYEEDLYPGEASLSNILK
jgi:HisJ family histidinol phosphate phosphatase